MYHKHSISTFTSHIPLLFAASLPFHERRYFSNISIISLYSLSFLVSEFFSSLSGNLAQHASFEQPS